MKYLKADELAKDMSMQVFEKVTADITRFEIVHFKSWLYKVTCNSCLMQLRSNKHFQTLSIDDENVLKKNVEISIDEHHFKENNHEMKIEQLQMAIETLNYEQKQCVTLFYLQEKSYKDVAELTGFSENSVKSYIQNGKRNLKNILLKSFESGVWLLLILNMK
jgi:RNA polymerase sigma-70 factor (ECF subfamily)